MSAKQPHNRKTTASPAPRKPAARPVPAASLHRMIRDDAPIASGGRNVRHPAPVSR